MDGVRSILEVMGTIGRRIPDYSDRLVEHCRARQNLSSSTILEIGVSDCRSIFRVVRKVYKRKEVEFCGMFMYW